MSDLSRRDALRLAGTGATGAVAVGLAGCLGGSSGDRSGDGGGTGDAGTDAGDGTDGGTASPTDVESDWRTATLTDVRTDGAFSIDGFDRPVLVETFAVWCSNCKRQQDELVAFHDAVGDDVVSVALNVDPNEEAAKVREHAETHGYHWRYALSPPAVTRSLVDEFGASMTNPPIVPMVLRCPDGSAERLKDGHKSTAYLRDRVDGC